MKVKAKQIQITNGKLLIGGSSTSTETGYTIPASVGSNGHVLTSDGTNVIFQATSGSSTSISDADSNTKIQVEESSDENKIRFDTAGTERMIIADDGKVGIGTSTPSHALDISGDLRVRGNGIRDNSGNVAITMDGSANVTIPNNLIVDGDGSANGITITDGSIAMRTGTGSVAKIDMYCESSNAHYVSLKPPPHADFSGNIDFILPSTEGSSGQYLKTDGNGKTSWGTVSAGGGGGLTYSAQTSSSFTIAVDHHYSVNIGSATTLTLPSSGSGQISFKNMNSATLTVQAASGKTLDGTTAGSVALSQYEAVTVITDGSGNWEIR